MELPSADNKRSTGAKVFSARKYFKLGSTSYPELGKRVFHKISEDGCPEYAAAMAYYLLFALFPFVLFLTTLIGYLPFPNLLEFVLDTMKRFLPEQVFTLLQDNIRTLFSNKKGGLLSLGILLALWTSSSAVTSIVDVMNRLYAVKEGRPFWKVGSYYRRCYPSSLPEDKKKTSGLSQLHRGAHGSCHGSLLCFACDSPCRCSFSQCR